MPTSSSTVRLFSSSFKNKNKVWLARVIEKAILLRTVDRALKETLHNLNSFISLQINPSTPKYMYIYTVICQILGWWDNENNFDTIPWTNPVVTFWRKKYYLMNFHNNSYRNQNTLDRSADRVCTSCIYLLYLIWISIWEERTKYQIDKLFTLGKRDKKNNFWPLIQL